MVATSEGRAIYTALGGRRARRFGAGLVSSTIADMSGTSVVRSAAAAAKNDNVQRSPSARVSTKTIGTAG